MTKFSFKESVFLDTFSTNKEIPKMLQDYFFCHIYRFSEFI